MKFPEDHIYDGQLSSLCLYFIGCLQIFLSA